MLFLKNTMTRKAPGIYDVDVAARPPGRTYGVYMAIDPDNSPAVVLGKLQALGFEQILQAPYIHRDGGKVLDLHFQKQGSDLFQGWKSEECEVNLAHIHALFDSIGIDVKPRVMSPVEAFA